MKITSIALAFSLCLGLSTNAQFDLKKIKSPFSKKKEATTKTNTNKQTPAQKANASNTYKTDTQNRFGAKGLTSPAFANQGRTWFISRANGKGQLGTKEKPAKDLGNIIHKLKPNDVVYITGGVYVSKGKRGSDEINVPIKIYGGFDETFTKRDPWGENKTIFTGVNEYMKLTQPRLYFRTDQQRDPAIGNQLAYGSEIIVDGIIFDNGPRNRYHLDKNLAIRRQASPKSGKNPSPESGGLVIVPSKFMNVTVKNCVVMNTAPTQGALAVGGSKGATVLIENNLTINNTGNGIHIKTLYTGSEKDLIPFFTVKNNTSLFSWKHDPIASYGGNAIAMDKNLKALVENNVFGFGHMGGVYSKLTDLTLNNNIFTGNKKYDFKERNNEMNVEDILDESEALDQNSDGNESKLLKINVAERWAKIYGQREEISREQVDASVKASNSGANQLRSMLGLNVQGSDVKMDAEIFLPLITIDEALPAGLMRWEGKGCAKPQ